MFTVKWINEGKHSLYAARNVEYTPANQVDKGADGMEHNKAQVSWFEVPLNLRMSVDTGEVYVMNGQGATVGKYILGTSEYKHGVEPSA